MKKLDASFIIATRNRPDVLIPCLRSCLAQVDIESEILVYDDASDEDMRPILAKEFGKRVKVARNEVNRGYVAIRAQALADAASDYVVQIDDDVVLFDKMCVNRACNLLATSHDIGAVALRYYEHCSGKVNHRKRTPEELGDTERRSFVGCAVVLRRAAAIKAGGYSEWLYHQGEERFLAIRMLDLGYRIVLSGPPSIIHLVSPIRDRRAMSWYGIRNTLLFDWICVPQPYLLPYLAKDVVKLFLYKLSLNQVPKKCAAIGWGLLSIVGKWRLRKPVKRATFRKYLSLPRHGPLPVPPDWDPTPLVEAGIINSRAELDPYLKRTVG